MSDIVWQAIIGAVVTIVLAYMSSRNRKKLDTIAATGEKTHTLVNSNFGIQLKLNATVSRRVADLTKDPADIEAADAADLLLRDHEAKQATVDAGPQ